MNIRTRFQPGDTVYLIDNNTIVSSVVASVHVTAFDGDSVFIEYKLRDRYWSFKFKDGLVNEFYVFRSKDELVKHLLG